MIKKSFILFGACLLISLLLRSYSFYSEIMQVDEADFAAQGYMMAQGAVPYVDFVEKKPVLSYLFYAGVFYFFGWDMNFVHLALAIWVSLTSLFLYWTAVVSGYPREGLWIAIGYSVYSICLPTNAALAAKTEYFLNLPSVISVLFFFIILKKENRVIFNSFFCGLFVGFASLFKHQGGILLLTYFIYFIFFERNKKKVFYSYPFIIFGFGAPWVLCLIIYNYFGYLNQFIEWNFLNNFKYIQANFSPLFSFFRFLKGIGTFLIWAAPFIYFILKAIKRVKTEKSILFMAIWFVTGVIALSVGGRFSIHYFIQLFPSFIFISSFGFVCLLDSQLTGKFFKRAFFIVLIIVPVGWAGFHWVSHFARLYGPQFPIVSDLSEHVAKISDKKDKIFIWGYFSYPYYLSQRMPGSRFIICEYLVPYWEKKYTDHPHFEPDDLNDWHRKNLSLLLSDLEKNKPRYFIDTSTSPFFADWTIYQINKFPMLNEYLKKHYKKYDFFQDVTIYQLISEK